jgi:hypothetical protein
MHALVLVHMSERACEHLHMRARVHASVAVADTGGDAQRGSTLNLWKSLRSITH